tara:strand:- start:54 stop:827 length:774 start_codon:yes stop_codon:yes gene_type:complete
MEYLIGFVIFVAIYIISTNFETRKILNKLKIKKDKVFLYILALVALGPGTLILLSWVIKYLFEISPLDSVLNFLGYNFFTFVYSTISILLAMLCWGTFIWNKLNDKYEYFTKEEKTKIRNVYSEIETYYAYSKDKKTILTFNTLYIDQNSSTFEIFLKKEKKKLCEVEFRKHKNTSWPLGSSFYGVILTLPRNGYFYFQDSFRVESYSFETNLTLLPKNISTFIINFLKIIKDKDSKKLSKSDLLEIKRTSLFSNGI